MGQGVREGEGYGEEGEGEERLSLLGKYFFGEGPCVLVRASSWATWTKARSVVMSVRRT